MTLNSNCLSIFLDYIKFITQQSQPSIFFRNERLKIRSYEGIYCLFDVNGLVKKLLLTNISSVFQVSTSRRRSLFQTHPCITRLDLMHYHQLILNLIYHGSLLFKEYGRISYRAIKVPVTCIYIYFLYQRNIGLIVVFALAFVFRKINVNFIGLTYFHSSLLFFLWLVLFLNFPLLYH